MNGKNSSRIIIGAVFAIALAATIIIEGVDVLDPLLDFVSGIFEPSPPTPNVVLLLMDTVRADHLGCYGYGQPTSPNLDSLSYSGTMYRHCQAQSSWTLPSMTSIFTGVSERAHGVNTTRDGFMNGVPDEYDMLPELMKEIGYETYAVYNVPVLDECYGFWQGIDHIDARGCTVTVDADYIIDHALMWLDERNNRDGFFMILHFFDAHYPYDPPAEYWTVVGLERPTGIEMISAAEVNSHFRNGELAADQLPIMKRLYDGEIMFMDAEIGRFLQSLRTRGLADNTIIIAIADHGEEFGEHGRLFHGQQLFQETVHVPWIMAGPGVGEHLAVNGVVGQFDVLPTLARYIPIRVPEYVEGLPAVPGDSCHFGVPSSGFSAGGPDMVAMRFDNAKVFWGPYMQPIAFDLREGETDSMVYVPDTRLTEMAAAYWSTPKVFTPRHAVIPSNRAQRLRDLGYF